MNVYWHPKKINMVFDYQDGLYDLELESGVLLGFTRGFLWLRTFCLVQSFNGKIIKVPLKKCRFGATKEEAFPHIKFHKTMETT